MNICKTSASCFPGIFQEVPWNIAVMNQAEVGANRSSYGKILILLCLPEKFGWWELRFWLLSYSCFLQHTVLFVSL